MGLLRNTHSNIENMKNTNKTIMKTVLGILFLFIYNSSVSQIVINEIHADPAGDVTGDANGDGVRDPSDDEFIELVNIGANDLDVSGWKIFDTNSALTERHVFAQGTIVPVNGAIVIFGGGTPTGTFGGSIVQTATTGALGLTNSSDGIIIEDATATEIISYTYGSEAGSDQSITRSPDITGSDNPMVAHSTATGSGGALFSPGTKIDGTSFIETTNLLINEIHADPAGDVTGDANGDGVTRCFG